MIASLNRHLDVVKTLIEAGANVNHSNKVGMCTLICCIVGPGLGPGGLGFSQSAYTSTLHTMKTNNSHDTLMTRAQIMLI